MEGETQHVGGSWNRQAGANGFLAELCDAVTIIERWAGLVGFTLIAGFVIAELATEFLA